MTNGVFSDYELDELGFKFEGDDAYQSAKCIGHNLRYGNRSGCDIPGRCYRIQDTDAVGNNMCDSGSKPNAVTTTVMIPTMMSAMRRAGKCCNRTDAHCNYKKLFHKNLLSVKILKRCADRFQSAHKTWPELTFWHVSSSESPKHSNSSICSY